MDKTKLAEQLKKHEGLYMPYINSLKGEIFKEVKGTNGQYFVSNLGRVFSPPKKSNVNRNGIFLSPGERNGYLSVVLRSCSPKSFSVHRLVAQAFIENPKNKPQVNHKNGDRKDNVVDNLEWVTNQENKDHQVKFMPKEKTKKQIDSARKVCTALGESKRLLSMNDAKSIRGESTGKRGEAAILAKKYMVGAHIVRRILNNETYIGD